MTRTKTDKFGPTSRLLDDGKRLHLRHGPIDLVIEAFGNTLEVTKSYQRATKRFSTILDELVNELELLRSPVSKNGSIPKGRVAKRMYLATQPLCKDFITAMAAVAGAVADEILAAMISQTGLEKVYVNNGGDIALYIHPNATATFKTAIVSNPQTGKIIGTSQIGYHNMIGGIATSGWRGRSHSLGIADCVTVFAKNAATADAAATIIANHIDLPGHKNIERQAANLLSPDSDLEARKVTTNVGHLTKTEIDQALQNGAKLANKLFGDGKITAAFLCLQNHNLMIGENRPSLTLAQRVTGPAPLKEVPAHA